MSLNCFKLSLIAGFSLVVSMADGYAQQFGGSRTSATSSVEQAAPAYQPAARQRTSAGQAAVPAGARNTPNIDYGVFDNPQVTEKGNIVIPAPNLPKTKDGSQRGDVAIIEIPTAGQEFSPDADKELIFLYYEDFEITRGFGGSVGCNVKFVVVTSLNERLSNLSVKLKWPDISTSLSFDDVRPNIATYYNYALFGDGCYTMNKIPNIVVNRCRIKGISQQACAQKIRWLSKNKQ